MSTLDSPPSPGAASLALSERQRAALVSLLADEDPAVYQAVREKLLALGPAADPWLRPGTLSADPTLRRRAREILTYQARQAAHERFLGFCRSAGEDLDLEEGTLLLSQTRDPQANRDAYRALYDDWAGELRGRLAIASEPSLQLGLLNKFLFTEKGFEGREHYVVDPDCSYLTRVVDRRSGNPISLCAVYLFLARRLRLPVSGIGLPGHFVCRYLGPRGEFYIDCFRRGAFLSKSECVKHVIQSTFIYRESQLQPLSTRRMLLRMCHNLAAAYGHLEEAAEAGRVQAYIDALSAPPPPAA
ncbi:MAG: hypothetical protein RJA22_361 [Verrucomicrobiota bacterium]|jgi:regulator of sirC expression with transglutaminase-like and TPR domain